jgi:hypothetical protein
LENLAELSRMVSKAKGRIDDQTYSDNGDKTIPLELDAKSDVEDRQKEIF